MSISSQEDINLFAAWAALRGGSWQLTSWQGCNSITFRNDVDSLIIQFRDHTQESFSPSMLELVKQVHPHLAPTAQFLGTMPKQPNFEIWQMELMPGDPYLFHVQYIDSTKLALLVEDLAKYFAEQWRHPQRSGHFTTAGQYRVQLHELLKALPTTFASIIEDTLRNLDSIMELPKVVTHSDLSSGNILIEPNTGHLSGIVDWAEATIEPFGLSLYALHDIIGLHDENGYHYLKSAATHRAIFCQVFKQETNQQGEQVILEQARILGVLLRYGFIWNTEAGARRPPTNQKDLDFLQVCLDGSIFGDKLHLRNA